MKACSVGRGDLSREVLLAKAGGEAIKKTLSKAAKLAKKRARVSGDILKTIQRSFSGMVWRKPIVYHGNGNNNPKSTRVKQKRNNFRRILNS